MHTGVAIRGLGLLASAFFFSICLCLSLSVLIFDNDEPFQGSSTATFCRPISEFDWTC